MIVQKNKGTAASKLWQWRGAVVACLFFFCCHALLYHTTFVRMLHTFHTYLAHLPEIGKACTSQTPHAYISGIYLSDVDITSRAILNFGHVPVTCLYCVGFDDIRASWPCAAYMS